MVTTVNDSKLYYQIEGSGIPCLFINYMGTIFHQRTMPKELHKHFQLINVDLRGGGQSDPGIVEEMTLCTLMDDLDQLRQTLNLSEMAVMGHSGNLWLALEYARKYPTRVSHLILWGQGPGGTRARKRAQEYWEAHASEERKAELEKNLGQLGKDEQFDTFFTTEAFVKFYVAIGPQFWHDFRFDCSHLWKGITLHIDVIRQILHVIFKDYDATPFLSEITCPVFLALGKYDFWHPPTTWDGEREKFPNCTYHVFERSGHNLHYEEQTTFAEKLIGWIKSQ